MTTTCDLEALDDRVLIKPIADDKTEGGILLPDSADQKAKPLKGTVLAVGPGKLNERTGERWPMTVRVGEEVYFSRYGGQMIERGGNKFVVAREGDLLARVQKGGGW